MFSGISGTALEEEMPRFYGKHDWNPRLICAQIACLQVSIGMNFVVFNCDVCVDDVLSHVWLGAVHFSWL